jgi:ABC-type polysaccharide/polyol phosphate export permease
MENFFAFFFVGAIVYSLVSAVFARGPAILLGAEHFLKKIPVPKQMFVLNTVCYETVNFLITFTALMLLGMLCGVLPVTSRAPLAIVGVLLLIPFLFGIAMLLSVATIYFRDLLHMVPVGIQALFFVSPIAFDRPMVPERFQWIVAANPLSYFLDLVRAPLVFGRIPGVETYAVAVMLAIVVPAVGIAVLRYCDEDIIFRL